jgi:hypothetical protein
MPVNYLSPMILLLSYPLKTSRMIASEPPCSPNRTEALLNLAARHSPKGFRGIGMSAAETITMAPLTSLEQNEGEIRIHFDLRG